MSVLKLSNLSVKYGNNTIIDDLDLVIEPGEIVALFGPSGGGKSTVLKAITGLLDEVTGEVNIANVCVYSDSVNVPTEKRHIGLIFQDYALFPHLTVMQNITFGISKLPKAEQKQTAQQLLELIKMTEYGDSYPHQLSGGQQQRIAIARALACKPSILLFDEAFSNIDPHFRFELIADIRQLLKERGISALFVTHNQDEAFAFCDRIAILNDGKIEQIATAKDLFSKPKTKFVAEFLGQGLWLRCQVSEQLTLVSELGELNYHGDTAIEPWVNKYVDVYIRPHQLKLTRDDASSLVVNSERFVGEFYESTIHWFGQSVTVRTSHSFNGDNVALSTDTPVSQFFPETLN